jgi:O-antigen/teichoic acid export membrane protein
VHWRTIVRSVCSNWAAYFVTAVVGFVLAPKVVHALGDTGYGLWTLILSLTGYFGLLDLGIRSSVGRFVARHAALGDPREVNKTISTAFVLLSFGSLLTLVATAAAAIFFFDAFNIEPQYRDSARIALIITGINIALVLPLGVFSSVLVGLDRFDIVSGVSIVLELMRAVAMLGALKAGYGIIGLSTITLLLTIGGYVTYIVFAIFVYPTLRLALDLANVATLKELFGFGIWRFTSVVANQLIFYSDSVVIGLFLGAGSITRFAIAGTLVNYGRTIVSLLTDTFYPAATRLDAKNDMHGLRDLFVVATRVTLLIAFPLCFVLLFLSRQFVTLWMGPDYANASTFVVLLTIPQFTSMPQYVSALVLAGMARHRFLAKVAAAEGVLNVLLSVILVQKMGLIGVAWGTVIPHILSSGIIIPWYTLGVLNMSAREYFVRAWLRPLVAAVPAAALAWIFSARIEPVTWSLFFAEAAAIGTVVVGPGAYLCLSADQRTRIIGWAFSKWRRKRVKVAGDAVGAKC